MSTFLIPLTYPFYLSEGSTKANDIGRVFLLLISFMFKSNKAVIWTTTFECRCLGVDLRTDTQDIFKKRNRLRAPNMIPILHLVMIWFFVWPLNEHGNFHFDNGCHVHMTSKNHEANDLDWDLALIACFLFCEKWMQWGKYPNSRLLPWEDILCFLYYVDADSDFYFYLTNKLCCL